MTTSPESAKLDPSTSRLQRSNRGQLELRSVDLDGLLGADHRARLVSVFVEGLDVGPLYERMSVQRSLPPGIWICSQL